MHERIRETTVKRLLAWLAVLGLLPLSAAAQNVTYIHTDALGSPVLETNAQAQVVRQVDYRAYGMEVMDAPRPGPGYTGHYRDVGTGLVYMQQRYYDPMVGRFLSVDPVPADPKSGTNFNRYWYANNSPYSFLDPDGRYSCPTEHCGAVGKFVSRIAEARGKNDFGSAMYRRLNRVVNELGSEGSAGPQIVGGTLKSGTLANWNQDTGVITMDFEQIAAATDSVQAGAQALGHEVQHNLWKADNNGKTATTEPDVRASEVDAYSTSRGIDESMGLKWSDEKFDNAVQGSVDNWKSKQGAKSE
jgi:RHS repeat-associated protein